MWILQALKRKYIKIIVVLFVVFLIQSILFVVWLNVPPTRPSDCVLKSCDEKRFKNGNLVEIAQLEDNQLEKLQKGFKKRLVDTYFLGDCEFKHYEVTNKVGFFTHKYHFVGGIQTPYRFLSALTHGKRWKDIISSNSLLFRHVLPLFDDFSRIYNLQYSLKAGIMMGLCRNSLPIIWDSDLDVYMPNDSFHRVREMWNSGKYERGSLCNEFKEKSGPQCAETTIFSKSLGKNVRFGVRSEPWWGDQDMVKIFTFVKGEHTDIDIFRCQERLKKDGSIRDEVCYTGRADSPNDEYKQFAGFPPFIPWNPDDVLNVTLCGVRTRVPRLLVERKECFCRDFVDHRWSIENGRKRFAHPRLRDSDYLPREKFVEGYLPQDTDTTVCDYTKYVKSIRKT